MVTFDALDNPARVLFVHPSAELYGSDRMFLESVRAVADLGQMPMVVLPCPGPLVAELQAAGARVTIADFPVLRKAFMNPRGFARLAHDAWVGWGQARRMLAVEKIDVVFVNTVISPIWLLWARMLGCKTVAHVHEAEWSMPIPLWKVLCLPLSLAQRVLVNSYMTRDYLALGNAKAAARSVLIRNALGGSWEYTPPRPKLDQPIKLLFVGRLSDRKGMHVLLPAVRELLDAGVQVELEVVGDAYQGKEAYVHDLRQQIVDLNLEETVTMCGFDPDVPAKIAAADISIVPSVGPESFGNTAVEPLLVGRPVVLSSQPGLQEAGSGFRSVAWHTPGAVSELAAAIKTVIDQWDDIQQTLPDDAELAQDRHSPRRYHAHVAQTVDVAGPLAVPDVVTKAPAVTIAVLTFRRNELLQQLLPQLADQAATLDPPAKVLVVDTDPAQGARHVAEALLPATGQYVASPEPGIAQGRNVALDVVAQDDVVVFLDDDETPSPEWLRRLVAQYQLDRPAAVVGPVVPDYQGEPPQWVERGQVFRTARRPTGTLVPMAATNNLLLDVATVRRLGLRFDPDYSVSGGSDTKFTWAMSRAGERLVWVDEAPVKDQVPASRMTRNWVWRRAFRLANGLVRVDADLSGWGIGQKVLHRSRYLARGVARVGGGAVRAAWGSVTGRTVHTERGLRTMARGAGMITGAVGYVYCEYKSQTVIPVQRDRTADGVAHQG